VKRAIPVRMPPWPRNEWPTTKQLELCIYFWEKQKQWKPLAEDPGIGVGEQASFWLDAKLLDDYVRSAGCLRGGRPDRAGFIRRLATTYHAMTAPRSDPSPVVGTPRSVLASHDPFEVAIPVRASGLSSESATALPRPTAAPSAPNRPKPIPTLSKPKPASSAPPRHDKTAIPPAPPKARQQQTLQPGKVNELSRQQGLGIGWQPGNLYRIGRNVFGKRCLIQFDANGVQLASYGSW
jgi:hypothetical protein